MANIVLSGSATDLDVLKQLTPADLFASGGTEPIYEAIKKEVSTFVPDTSTVYGRKEIASVARKIASSKNFIDEVGKVFNSDLKEKTKAVDKERKAIWDKLEALQAEIRKPLTEWEEKENTRVQSHKDAMAELEAITSFSITPTLSDVEKRVVRHAELRTRKWEEFDEMATPIFFSTHDALMKLAKTIKQAEKDKAELEALRAAKVAQEANDAEEARQKAAAEERQRIEKEAAEKAQRNAEIAIQAEKEKVKKAEEARIAAEARAKLEAEQAVQREKERVAAEQKRKDDEAKKRENDRAHHAKINREAMEAIQIVINANLSGKDTAKAIVVAIAEGKIPNVKIFY